LYVEIEAHANLYLSFILSLLYKWVVDKLIWY